MAQNSKDAWWDINHLTNAAQFGRTMVLMAGVGTTIKRYFGHLRLNLFEAYHSIKLGLFAILHGLFPFFGGFHAAYMVCRQAANTFRFIPLHPSYRELYEEMHEFYTSEEYKELLKERNMDETSL